MAPARWPAAHVDFVPGDETVAGAVKLINGTNFRA